MPVENRSPIALYYFDPEIKTYAAIKANDPQNAAEMAAMVVAQSSLYEKDPYRDTLYLAMGSTALQIGLHHSPDDVSMAVKKAARRFW